MAFSHDCNYSFVEEKTTIGNRSDTVIIYGDTNLIYYPHFKWGLGFFMGRH